MNIPTLGLIGIKGMMEFPFDINQLFPDRVSILDHSFDAAAKPGRFGTERSDKGAGFEPAAQPCVCVHRTDLQASAAAVIDELGRASATVDTR